MDEQLAREGHFSSATFTNPSIFRIARYLLTQDTEFEVQGTMTGGEGEVGGDSRRRRSLHLRRQRPVRPGTRPALPDKPKQMCPHPIASTAGLLGVKDHWDDLRIQSTVTVQGHAVPLQDSRLEALVTLDYLLDMASVRALPDAAVLFCGSSPFLDSAEDAVKRARSVSLHHLGRGATRSQSGSTTPYSNGPSSTAFVPVPVGDDLAERQSEGRALPNFPMMD